MSNREISAHMKEIYGVGVSAEFISRVTDEVLEDVLHGGVGLCKTFIRWSFLML